MKLLKKVSLVAATALAMGCGTASANVIEHVQLNLQSGGTFIGDITFADKYNSIVSVDGYLNGDGITNDRMAWTYNSAYSDAINATGIPGVVTDFLLDGDPLVDWQHTLGISWFGNADSLTFDLDSSVPTDYQGLDDLYRIVSATVGNTSPPSPPSTDVPEPASAALLGLGFLGFMASRHRPAKGKTA